MDIAVEMASRVGVAPLCQALGKSRATFYRHRQPGPAHVEAGARPKAGPGPMQDQSARSPVVACDHGTEGATVPPAASADEVSLAAARSEQEPLAPPAADTSSPRALSRHERERVIALLDSERFCDLAPAEIYATLLDEGIYLCSERTMYRILAEQGQVRDRRAQRRHPKYVAPELMASRPNQLWSWDITKLKTFVKSQYLHLYVILDVFSRYVVGWMVAERESGELAKLLIDETCERQGIAPGELTFHADNGAAMVAQPVAFLLASLGVTKSHSRPHVSDDNPFYVAWPIMWRPAGMMRLQVGGGLLGAT
jgi:putative transposase